MEVVTIAVVVMITGTPPAVGLVGSAMGVGRSMRFSVSVVVVVLLAELALYGTTRTSISRCSCGANAGDEREEPTCVAVCGVVLSAVGGALVLVLVQAVSWEFTPKTELPMVASRAGLVIAGSKVTYNGGDRPGGQHFGD